MQELVKVTSCDIEYDDTFIKVEAIPVPWHVEGTPWVIDMCKDHRDSVAVSQMDDIVRTYGRPLEERESGVKAKPKAKAKEIPAVELERVLCPFPDCGADYKNRGSLAGHFSDAHRKTLATWEAEQAGMEPEIKCNFKGANCRLKFHTAQAMTAHKVQRHGWRKGDE